MMLNKSLTFIVKNLLVLVLFSLGVIYGAPHLRPTLFFLVSSRDWISQLLLQVFSGGQLGFIIRKLLSLLAIPLLVGAIPAFIYWLSKRRRFPYLMQVIWAVWLIQTTAIVLLQH